MDVATGSLGPGLAAGHRHRAERATDRPTTRTYVLLGDGETAEGSVWEAADSPRITNSTTSARSPTSTGSARAGRRSSITISTVHRGAGARSAGTHRRGRPRLAGVLQASPKRGDQGTADDDHARTLKGKGVSSMEGKDGWHGKALKKGDGGRTGDRGARDAVRAARSAAVMIPKPARGAATPPPADFVARRRRPTRSATRSRRARLMERPSLRSAQMTRASSRSTPTSRTPRSARSSRRSLAIASTEMFIAEQVMVGAAMGLPAGARFRFRPPSRVPHARADFIRMAGISEPEREAHWLARRRLDRRGRTSQMALEDLATMRAVPDCTVLYPCDAVSADG